MPELPLLVHRAPLLLVAMPLLASRPLLSSADMPLLVTGAPLSLEEKIPLGMVLSVA